MDFRDLMSLAQYNEQSSKKRSHSGVSTDLSAPKKVERGGHPTGSSEALKRLREEKEHERAGKERKRRQEEREAEKKKIFRIPKGNSSKGQSENREARHEAKGRTSDHKEKGEKSKDSYKKTSSNSEKKKKNGDTSESKRIVSEAISLKEKKVIKGSSSQKSTSSKPTAVVAPISTVQDYDYTKDVEQMQYTFKGPRQAQPAQSAAWARMEAQIKKEKKDLMRKKAEEISRKFSEDLQRKKEVKERAEREKLEHEQRKKDKEERRLKEAASKEFHSSKERSEDRHKHRDGHGQKHSQKPSSPSVRPDTNSVPKPKPKPKPVLKRPKPTGAPPLDFTSILKMAEQKQQAPKDEPEIVIPKKKKKEERPMTQEEKERAARRKTKEYQDWIKRGTSRPESSRPQVSSDSESFSDISDDDPLDAPPSAKHAKSFSKGYSSSHKSNSSSASSKLSNSFSGSTSKMSGSRHDGGIRIVDSKSAESREHISSKMNKSVMSSSNHSKYDKRMTDRHKEHVLNNENYKHSSDKISDRHSQKHQSLKHKAEYHQSLQHKEKQRVQNSKERIHDGAHQKYKTSGQIRLDERSESLQLSKKKYKDSPSQGHKERQREQFSQDKHRNSPKRDLAHRERSSEQFVREKHRNSPHGQRDRHSFPNVKHKETPQSHREVHREHEKSRDKYRDNPKQFSKDKYRDKEKHMGKEKHGDGRDEKKSRPQYDDEHENVLVCGPASPEPPSPPKASNPFDRIVGEIKKNNPKPKPVKRKRQIIDSESEDEEMADFIDDGDDDEIDDPSSLDYSKYIRQIFGYDKRKFAHLREDDVDNMESNYATVMKEEARSARLGLLEDLEDMKQEQEELHKKAMMKKKRR